jgi:hypothetical protein
MRPGRNVDRSGTDGGWGLAPLRQIRSVVFPRGEDERQHQQRADHREILTSALKKPGEELHQPAPAVTA